MLGVFRQEQADFEQHPPELREEPARRPKAAVNKEAAGTALLLGAGLAGGNPRTRGGRGGWRGVRPPQSEVLPACVEGREAAPRGMLVINRKHSVSTTGGDGCTQPPERHGSTEKNSFCAGRGCTKTSPVESFETRTEASLKIWSAAPTAPCKGKRSQAAFPSRKARAGKGDQGEERGGSLQNQAGTGEGSQDRQRTGRQWHNRV